MVTMDVVLWDDYLKTVRPDSPHKEVDIPVIAKIEPIEDFPGGLISINGIVYSCSSLSNKQGRLTVTEIKSIPAEDDFYSDSEITCPHCGVEYSDSWEHGDDGEEICDYCGSEFTFSRDISVSYSTVITKRNDKILAVKAIDG